MKITNKIKSRLAGLSLTMMIVSMFTVGVAQAVEPIFSDVQPSDWFYTSVENLAWDGVIDTSSGKYRPKDFVTRAEMAKLAVKAFNLQLVNPATPTFKDVPKTTSTGETNWAYQFVETAYKSGVIGGYTANGKATGYYGPGDRLTREQAMKIIILAAKLQIKTAGGPHFSDVKPPTDPNPSWSYQYVETGYNWSVVDGMGDGTFAPLRNVLRSEIAKMINNALNPIVRVGAPSPQPAAGTKLDVTLNVQPPNQNVVSGKADFDVAGWDFVAASGSNLKVTSVTVTCAYTDTTGDGDICENVWTNGRLYFVEGANYALLEGGKSFNGGKVVFNMVNHLIPAGATHKLVLRADTSAAADINDKTDFNITANTDIAVEDAGGNALDTSKKTTDAAMRSVIFTGAGTLTVSLSGTTPLSDAIVAGTSGLEATVIRLSANGNEDIIVKKLRFANWEQYTTVGSFKLYEGDKLLETSTYSIKYGDVSFDNLNVVVPANGNKLLRVVIDSNLIGPGSAESGQKIQIGMNKVDSAQTYDSRLNDIMAVGASSGKDVALVNDITMREPGIFTIYNTIPSLTRTAASPTSASVGPNTPLLEFRLDVTGKAGESGTMKYIEIAFNGTCANKPTKYLLYSGGGQIGDSEKDLMMSRGEFFNGNGIEVQAGSSSTQMIQADTTGCLPGQTLQVIINYYSYDDVVGALMSYAPHATINNYLNFDSNPFPMASPQFTF